MRIEIISLNIYFKLAIKHILTGYISSHEQGLILVIDTESLDTRALQTSFVDIHTCIVVGRVNYNNLLKNIKFDFPIFFIKNNLHDLIRITNIPNSFINEFGDSNSGALSDTELNVLIKSSHVANVNYKKYVDLFAYKTISAYKNSALKKLSINKNKINQIVIIYNVMFKFADRCQQRNKKSCNSIHDIKVFY